MENSYCKTRDDMAKQRVGGRSNTDIIDIQKQVSDVMTTTIDEDKHVDFGSYKADRQDE